MDKPICITSPNSSLAPEVVESKENSRQRNRLSTLRKGLGICLGSIVLGAGIGAYAGVETTTETTLAGNDATVELDPGSNLVQVDVGLLGLKKLSNYSIASVPMGAKIHLSATSSNTIKNKFDDSTDEAIIAEYLQIYSDPGHEIQQITADTTKHVIDFTRNGALSGLALFGLGAVAYEEHKKARNKLSLATKNELRAAYKPLRQKTKLSVGFLGAVVAASACVSGNAVINSINAPPIKIEANPIFNGTALEGSELVGIGAPLVDYVAQRIERYITDNDQYYNQVVDNFHQAFDEFTTTNQLPEGDNIVPMILFSDRHCNVGMDRVIVAVAKKFKALIGASGGDDYFSGTFSFETACLSGLADRLASSDIQLVTGIGNHDPRDGEINISDHNILILDGISKVISTPNGDVTFLSQRDPRRSTFGNKIVPFDKQDQLALLNVQGKEIGALACASSKPIDVLIAHDKQAAETAFQYGCDNIRFSLSGHHHEQEQPKHVYNNSYLFVEGTTGGATQESPSYGPLKRTADFSILYYDSSHHHPIDIINITVRVDGSVKINDYTPLFDQAPIIKR